MNAKLNIVIFGLSITSSWGNGHATTFRSLVKALSGRGHTVLFLERDVPWYAANRDLPCPPFGNTVLYTSLDSVKRDFAEIVKGADLCLVGSYVPDGIGLGEWVIQTSRGLTAFYDIDTPVTLAGLARNQIDYLSEELIAEYDLFLSFTGGPVLKQLEEKYRSPLARALYCSFDPEIYFPEQREQTWDVGYLGTYSADRQPSLDLLLLDTARRLQNKSFIVAGPMYPSEIQWPPNVDRQDHIAPAEHRSFYNAQKFTLNITRADMIETGFSPSVRLFEAAACATPIISDYWRGLETVFEIDGEILVASTTDEVVQYLRELSDTERREIGRRARQRVLAHHTAEHRAVELEQYVDEARQTVGAGR